MGRCNCVNFGWVGGSHSGPSSSSPSVNAILRSVFLQFENIKFMILFFISVILVPYAACGLVAWCEFQCCVLTWRHMKAKHFLSRCFPCHSINIIG